MQIVLERIKLRLKKLEYFGQGYTDGKTLGPFAFRSAQPIFRDCPKRALSLTWKSVCVITVNPLQLALGFSTLFLLSYSTASIRPLLCAGAVCLDRAVPGDVIPAIWGHIQSSADTYILKLIITITTTKGG